MKRFAVDWLVFTLAVYGVFCLVENVLPLAERVFGQ